MMVSIIIPSHNRRSALRNALEAMAKQTYPAERFEVLVVLDGCSDGSAEMLRNYSAPYTLRFIEQEKQGSSVARNQGANQARGELLIFLDDDVEATPGLIQAHLDAHRGPGERVVIGYYPPALAGQKAYLSLELQGWWEAMFQGMHQPGHRFWYTDMLSGNFSISKKVFCNLGGFDPNMPVHEDYELGVRLIRAGVAFAFEKTALGLHHEQSDLTRSLKRKFQEGVADVRLGRLYPELIPTLLICRLQNYSLFASRILRYLHYRLPLMGEWIASTATEALPFFDKAHLLGMWRKTLYGLMGYWYWKGVAQELPTLEAVKDFLASYAPGASSQNQFEIALDLSLGLDQAERLLDQSRPHSARLLYGKRLIGSIPAEAGAERLRGPHLKPYLINQLVFLLGERNGSPQAAQFPGNLEEIVAFAQCDVLPQDPIG
jgi:glycosyltransferase involved in cell wall biosynthesis